MSNIGPDRSSGGIATSSTATSTTPAVAFAPSPALELVRAAAALVGGNAGRIVVELERDYPSWLDRSPALLVRAAGAVQRDLTELVRAAGFHDFDDLRRYVARERPSVARPRRAVPPEPQAEPDAALRREQDALAGTLRAVRTSGELELAAGAVLGSRRRWVFGDLRSRGYAQLFAADLTTALGQVVLVDPTAAGVLAAVGDAQRRDSLTVFSFRRYSRLSVRLSQQFAERGATVVAVTDDDRGPFADHATHLLRVITPDADPSPAAAAAVGHALATLATAGAKGSARRAEKERTVAADLQWYVDGVS